MFLPGRGVGFRGFSVLLIVVILATGIALALLNGFSADESERRRLRERAATIATALPGAEIAQLTGQAEDDSSMVYKELKTRLRTLKESNTDARSIYLAGLRDGEIFFYVDSEAPESEYFSPPGEAYPEATAEFKSVFTKSAPLVEGPVADSFGNWVSGFAPVLDFKTGRLAAVVGIDIDATAYIQSIVLAAAAPLVICLLLAAIIFAYEWVRRRDQQLLRLRSELVSIASHELRTPITGIRWGSETLLKTAAGTTAEPVARAIHDSAERLQTSVEDILQLTYVTTSSKAQKLNLAPCAMTSLVKEVCDTQRLAAQQRKIELVIDQSWPPHLLITCDADKIKRALHNLVSNAIKYTRENTEVVLHYESRDNQHYIRIKDQGIGIPAAEQTRVLEGFYRASNAKKTGAKGTGLGLYLTRSILEQHGGRLLMASQEGEGTTFTMVLPEIKV